MEYQLSVHQLTKYYNKLCALDHIELQVPKGSIYGILGPNGSGKTTFLGIITDVLKAHSGEFHWLNKHKNHRQEIGTLLETPNFYPYLSARDNLLIHAKTKGSATKDIDKVLKTVSLYQRRYTPFKTFSLGMKQRLALASTLLGNPKVIILDEPTNGLDPVGIADIRNLIINLGKSGKTVIIASHLLDEIEKVCTHVAILKQGKLLTSGPVSAVLSGEDSLVISADNLVQLESILKTCPQVKTLKTVHKSLQLTLREGFTPAALNQFCFDHHIVLNQLHRQNNNLELKFLEITNPTS